MNDWLSNIEKRLKGLSKYRAGWAINVERARMARVIRELAARISEQQEVADIRVCPCRLHFKQGLSPDAKDVINDLAE